MSCHLSPPQNVAGAAAAAPAGAAAAAGAKKPMPLLPISSPQTIGLCASMPLYPNDIFICSYPKSGTTWTQHIVLSLLVKSASKKKAKKGYDTTCRDDVIEKQLWYNHVSEYAPFYEVDQHWDANKQELIESVRKNHKKLGQRVFNTHLHWDMLPTRMANESLSRNNNRNNNNKAKFIYLIRSPMDVCLSFYYHLSNQQEGGYDGNFDDFFNDWVEGKIAFGSYVDHIVSFAPAFVVDDASNDQEVLLISYEDMISELPAVVTKIARFIQADISNDEIQELLPTFTFQNMKANLHRFQPKSVSWKNDFKFLRKGISGDSLSVTTDIHRERLKSWFEKEDFIAKLKSLLSGDKEAETLDTILRVCCQLKE